MNKFQGILSLAAVSALMAGSAMATLIPAGTSTLASEDFTGYSLPTTVDAAVNGPALAGQAGGVGFAGVWAGNSVWTSDNAFGRSSVSTPNPISGDPAAAIGGNTGRVTRQFATALAKPATGSTEFYISGAGLVTSAYKPDWFQLLDSSNNMLFAFGNKGNIGIDGIGGRYQGITGFDSAGTQRFIASYVIHSGSNAYMNEYVWTNWVLYGNWASDGTMDLQLFINPAATDQADTDRTGPLTGSGIDARLTTAVANSSIAGLGLMTNRGGDNGFADNFKFEVVVPEPASLSLLALGGLAMLRRSR
jgi:hypothetical protein